MTRKAKEILKKLTNPHHRQTVLEGFNQEDLDPSASVGGDQEMKVLKEMNELQEFENENGSHGTV